MTWLSKWLEKLSCKHKWRKDGGPLEFDKKGNKHFYEECLRCGHRREI